MRWYAMTSFVSFIANRVGRTHPGRFTASIGNIVLTSIAIGIATILAAIMIMLGFKQEITKKLTSFSGDFQITKRGRLAGPCTPTTMQSKQLSDLARHLPPFIEELVPVAQTFMFIYKRCREGGAGMLCKGIGSERAFERLTPHIIAGRVPDLSRFTAPYELLIGYDLAKKLAVNIGDHLIAQLLYPSERYRKLKVVGIYRSYVQEIDSRLVFCDIRLIQRLHNWPSEVVNSYELFCTDGKDTPSQKARAAILPLLDYDLQLTSCEQRYPLFYAWLDVIKKNTSIFILFILLVAGSTMMATLLIQLMERRAMFRLLSLLGASSWQLYAILMWHSFRMLAYGMACGNIFGLGGCFLQHAYQWIKLEPKLYYMCYVPIYWNWSLILCLNICIMIALILLLSLAFLWVRKEGNDVKSLAD